ncbi:TPA: LysR family transcriptional regulator [Klebsiella pneumoniae]
MELRQCRYFISVAKLGSISQAALELHIAQPALTRQMQKLEEDLRVTLFNRTGRGVQLTDAGSQFLQKFSLLKRRPVRHRAEYDRLYLTRDQQLSCFDPIANREHQRASTTREYRRNWRTSSVRLK